MKALLILAAIVLVVITIGVVDNFFSNPVRGCREFDTGTEFRGFDCDGTNRYQP